MGAVVQGATGAHFLRPSPGPWVIASASPRRCAVPSLKDGRVGGPDASLLATVRDYRPAVPASVRPPVRPSAPTCRA
eukprot:5667926-Pleurochrysis_carterae.AAC.1